MTAAGKGSRVRAWHFCGRREDGAMTWALRYTSSMGKAIARWKAAAGIVRPVSPHDLRRTFVDLLRAAGADAVVEHALVGHADDAMRGQYSTVGDKEAASAVASVVRLVTKRRKQ